MNDIVVIGGKGQWGEKVVNDLNKANRTNSSIDSSDFNDGPHSAKYIKAIKEHASTTTATYLVVPPDQRDSCLKLLLNTKAELYIEKPNPGLAFEPLASTDNILTKSKFVDHYLQKHGFHSATKFIEETDDAVSQIEISICETAEEERNWMKQQPYGGVIYDLGHHAFSIMVRLLPELMTDDQGSIPDDKTKLLDLVWDMSDVNFFRGGSSAESEINVSFKLKNNKSNKKLAKEIACRIHIGKQCFVDQKHIIITTQNQKDEKNKHYFPLSGDSDYSKILVPDGRFHLNYTEAKQVDRFLHSLRLEVFGCKEPSHARTEGLNELTSTLKDIFLHRQEYFWGTYHKMLMYLVFIVIAPYLALPQLFGDGDRPPYFPNLILLMSLITLWIVQWLLKQLHSFLDAEDLRVKVSHKRMKQLLRRAGVDLEVPTHQKNIGGDMIILLRSVAVSIAMLSIVIATYLVWMTTYQIPELKTIGTICLSGGILFVIADIWLSKKNSFDKKILFLIGTILLITGYILIHSAMVVI